jgi:LysM repeat protein
MRYLMGNARYGRALLLLAILTIPPQVHAANAPYEIDIKDLDKQKAPQESQAKKHENKPEKTSKGRPAGSRAGRDGYVRYTVKPGDHIFKILTVRFGLSEDAADRLVPEIKRINHVTDIKKLRVGQTLVIPASGKAEAHSGAEAGREPRVEPAEAAAMLDAASRLEAQEPAAKETPPRAPEPSETTAAPAPHHTPPRPVPEPTWVCSITDRDPGKVVDNVLNALSIPWTRNKIIASGETAPNPYSIRVDRYFEYKGGRYIVNLGQADPYTYTLVRMLEGAGYRSLTVEPSDDVRTETEKLLRVIGVAAEFGRQPLQGGKEVQGFLIQPEDAGGRRVVITAERPDAGSSWLMKPGCLVR